VLSRAGSPGNKKWRSHVEYFVAAIFVARAFAKKIVS
jgi:hypothetical protein